MRGVTEKLRLRTFFCFFWIFFFLWTFKKNLFCQKKEIVYGNMLFCFCFFLRLFFGKILPNGTTPCPQKATSFQIKTPHPTKRFRTWKQKKTNLLKVILKYSGGIYSILNTFQNTKRQKYRINSICWKKTTFDAFVTIIYSNDFEWALFFLQVCFFFFLYYYLL